MIFRRYFFLCCCAFNTVFSFEPTKYQELPAPFSYLEHLYFCPFRYFIAFGNTSIPTDQIIQPIQSRHYRFICLSDPPRTLPKKFATVFSQPVHLLEDTTLLLMEYDKNFFFHFFHLLEHLAGIWAFYGHEYAHDVKRIIFARDFSDPDKNWEGPNQINREILSALFPHAEIWTWERFIKECGQGLACFEKVVISDRGISVYNSKCAKLNKHLGAALAHINPKHMDSFAQSIQTYAKTEQKDEKLQVTYIKRPPPRCLSESVERSLIGKISALPHVKLNVEDFARIPFTRQVNLIGNTDVLLSIHGNGLSHLLFLPPESCVIELFPPNSHQCDYHVFSEVRGIDYFGLMYKENAFLTRERSFLLSSYGELNSPIEELDIELIISTIQARACRKY